MSKVDFVDHANNLCMYRDNGTLRVLTINDEESKTIQSEKDNCDINVIVSRFKRTGVMNNLSTKSPLYGDFSEVGDFHTAQNRIIAAQEAFDALPSDLRKRFANDPGNLISFLDDPQNRSEAIKLGLVNADPQDSQIPQGDVYAEPISSSEQSST